MDIDTNNIKLNLNKVRINEKNERWIEQDIIVPDNMPDALKIISINSIPYINDVEINKNRAKVVGKISYNVVYHANDNNMPIRGLTISYPYTVDFESNNLENKEDIILNAKLKNIIYSLPNERKIAIKNEVDFNMEVKSLSQVEIIKDFSDGVDIESNKVENQFSNIICKKKCVITSSEDVMISKDASPMYEILKAYPSICNTEIKVSYNKLMLKGDLCVKLLYLGSKNSVCVENVKVPFSTMVEMDNITDKSQYDICYLIRDFNIKINPDIEQKTLNIDYKIEANIQMYENCSIEYVDDFYSRTRDLKYNVNDVNVVTQTNQMQKEISISDTLSDVLQNNQKIVEYYLDTNNVAIILDDKNINISGVAKLNLLVQDKETQNIDNKVLDIMVEKNIPLEDKYLGKYVNATIEDVSLNVIQNGQDIDIKVIIKIKIEAENVLNLNSINNIKEVPIDLKNISSINIYVVKPHDSIWKIAKKYKTSMNNIIQTNKLEDPNDIQIGQKILVIR